jgi:hypothetical protein
MKINDWNYYWEGLLSELRGSSSTFAKRIEVSALAPHGYGVPLSAAMAGQTMVTAWCLELSNLFHPSDTLDELASLFTFLSTTVTLGIVRLEMSQRCDVAQFIDP